METENRMISAEWLKTKFYEICDEYNTDRLHIDRIMDEIDNAPDVEVVRCKDCKYFSPKVDGTVGFCVCGEVCGYCHSMRIAEDYCSYGEKEDNE